MQSLLQVQHADGLQAEGAPTRPPLPSHEDLRCAPRNWYESPLLRTVKKSRFTKQCSKRAATGTGGPSRIFSKIRATF